jgi:hypothetical protein
MKNENLYYENIVGVWFHLDPYSDDLYSRLRAELIVDEEAVEGWLLSEVPHKEIKHFDEPAVVNVGAEYFIRLTFVESTELPPETNLVAGFVYRPESPARQVHVHPIAYESD